MNKIFKVAVHHLIPALLAVICMLILRQSGFAADWMLLNVIIIAVIVEQGVLHLLIPERKKQYTAGVSLLGILFVVCISCFPGKYVATIILVMLMWTIIVAVAAYCQNKGKNTRLS